MTDHSELTQGLTKNILIAMALGIVIGYGLHLAPADGTSASIYAFFVNGLFDFGGSIFIASLKMLVVPLVFVSLVCGVFAIGGNSRIGFISVKTIAFYLLTTAIAISIALLVSNIIDPGVGEIVVDEAKEKFVAKESPGIWAVLKDLVPANAIAAMAEAKMLQVIVFALLFGIALAKTAEDTPMIKEFFVQLDKVIMLMVMLLMKLAPFGVFCLIAKLFAETGFEKIGNLFKYFFTVILVLLIHASLTYGLLLKLLTGLNPMKFYSKMGRLWLFGFSTASSNATLPVTLETVEEKFGVKNEIASFTVPLGATINMDGTAIMQGVATVFIAQFFNIDLSLTDYLLVILTATLASIGTAGVPGVGLVMLTMVLGQVGLPVEGIAIIIGVDRILDMARTAVNITGDCTASVIIAKSEGKLETERFNS